MRYAALFVLALAAAAPAAADPSPQLVALVQQRIERYGLDVDVSLFDTATVARLYGILNENDDDYFRKRQKLKTALRNATDR
ncbi:hypothetical protein P1J78_18215 [Psychromarinibacter sp. C21-152]|uniref:Uncharacterized protein n=1 Tax=Psychromarinibacter sediminicola TaxID=3033385 RepID=A0AAE3TAB0_9RHOB|nr:hypothetical protein [Psychromarinibacter sediminicola]MDF0602678.1 hypothetical protein [Psychromarinibacter sediminicola]